MPYYTSWETRNLQQPCSVKIRAKNGIIWAAVSLKYGYNVQDGYDHYYATKTAFWDIESKKRLEPSDLFYEGTDIDEALNKYISGKSQEKVDAYYSYEMKADFMSLPKEGWSITPDGIYFDCGNPYGNIFCATWILERSSCNYYRACNRRCVVPSCRTDWS